MIDTNWWERLFASIDAKDTHGFLAYLTNDAMFRYGSGPEVHGRDSIGAVVDHVFSTFRASAHRLERRWEMGDCRVCQGTVTYLQLDGSEVPLPFCNVFTMQGELIARYEIFIDPTPLRK